MKLFGLITLTLISLWAQKDLTKRCPYHVLLEKLGLRAHKGVVDSERILKTFVSATALLPQTVLGTKIMITSEIAENEVPMAKLLEMPISANQLRDMTRRMDLAHQAFGIRLRSSRGEGHDIITDARFEEMTRAELRSAIDTYCNYLYEVLPPDVASRVDPKLTLTQRAAAADDIVADPSFTQITKRITVFAAAARTAMSDPEIKALVDRNRKIFLDTKKAREGEAVIDNDAIFDLYLDRAENYRTLRNTLRTALEKKLGENAAEEPMPRAFLDKLLDVLLK